MLFSIAMLFLKSGTRTAELIVTFIIVDNE